MAKALHSLIICFALLSVSETCLAEPTNSCESSALKSSRFSPPVNPVDFVHSSIYTSFLYKVRQPKVFFITMGDLTSERLYRLKFDADVIAEVPPRYYDGTWFYLMVFKTNFWPQYMRSLNLQEGSPAWLEVQVDLQERGIDIVTGQPRYSPSQATSASDELNDLLRQRSFLIHGRKRTSQRVSPTFDP